MAKRYAEMTSEQIEHEREAKRRRSRVGYARHLDASRAKSRGRNRQYREAALRAYGNACACCGEARYPFLTIDHVRGDGAAHRRMLFGRPRVGSGNTFYVWLKRHGYPGGFRVLCHNCNCARGYYGYCPHDAVDMVAVAQ